MTVLIIDNAITKDEAYALKEADENISNEDKAKEVLFTIFGDIRASYPDGSKTFSLSRLRLNYQQERCEAIIDTYVKPTLEENGYIVTKNYTSGDYPSLTGITVKWTS